MTSMVGVDEAIGADPLALLEKVMFVDYSPEFDKYCFFNNRGEVVAMFSTFEEAIRYKEQ